MFSTFTKLDYTVVLAGDGHSSYSRDAGRLIDEWNRKLNEAGVLVMPAAQIQAAMKLTVLA